MADHSLAARFGDSRSAPNRPTPRQIEGQRAVREAVLALAEVIEAHVPEPRNRAIALTGLEDVQMRANRGIYAELG